MVRAALALALATAGAPASFQEIVDGFGGRTKAETTALAEEFAQAHPEAPETPKAWMWAGDLSLQLGDRARAARDYERAKKSGGEWEFKAEKGLADIALTEHRWAEAISRYERVAASPDEYLRYVGSAAVETARAHRFRFLSSTALFVLLALLVIGRLGLALRRGGAGALWPLGFETKAYLLPAALVSLGAMRLAGPGRYAVHLICAGGLALVFSQGALARTGSPGRLGRLAWAAVAVLSAFALLYCAVIVSDLVEPLLETLKVGPDR